MLINKTAILCVKGGVDGARKLKVTLVHLSPLTQLFLSTTKKLLTTFKCYVGSHLTNRVWCYNFSGVAGIIAAAK